MKITRCELEGVLVIEPDIHEDERGYFMESWQINMCADIGMTSTAQDNFVMSGKNVLRGMHAQSEKPQGKLISVWQGVAWDCCVDIRPHSPTFGKWFGVILSASNHKQLWVPPGFAHGVYAVSPNVLLHYKCTELYLPEHAIGFRWNDPAVGIAWPCDNPVLSERDANALMLHELAL